MSENASLENVARPNESVAPLTRGPVSAGDRVPGWMPWAVLASLVALGVCGGLGFVPAGLPKQPAVSIAPAGAPSGVPGREPVITASHIVVSYTGTLLAARQRITRTKEEARRRAAEALGRARRGEDWTKLVAEYSDEPRAVEKKGLVGKFAQRHAVKSWGEAAFKLAPGEYSDVVETNFGFHVILRNE